jgi:uracil-DNA glycosylase
MTGLILERRLEQHRAALSACRACGDRVAGAIPILSCATRPRMMLVGQAPGQVEKVDQRPFAGRAGRTLFKWMEQAGISEDDVRKHIYIAAITRCYPGPSASGRGDRVPSVEEQNNCSRWLDGELALIRPEVVIPIGRLAIDRFLPRFPLERVIGKEHVVQMGGHSISVIPLPHPSGASSWLHAPGHAQLLAAALVILRRRLSQSLYL